MINFNISKCKSNFNNKFISINTSGFFPKWTLYKNPSLAKQDMVTFHVPSQVQRGGVKN